MEQSAPEAEAQAEGYRLIAGVDEAGRGPLAGPVVAAACILPQRHFSMGITDSKQLTPNQRAELYRCFMAHPDIEFGIGVVSHTQIDAINILQASLEAMRLAVEQLSIKPDFLLVDGIYLPKIEIPGRSIIKGDLRSKSIGAASIIAKHHRDQLMIGYDQQWPKYGFAKHKGYATRAHLEALRVYGPCSIHRHSFAPVKNLTLTHKSQMSLGGLRSTIFRDS
ncbi:MAG: ribonuclease HII [Chlamydiota bacterium]